MKATIAMAIGGMLGCTALAIIGMMQLAERNAELRADNVLLSQSAAQLTSCQDLVLTKFSTPVKRKG